MRAVEDNDRIEDEIDRRIELIWNTEDIIGQALVLLTNEGVCDHLLDDVVLEEDEAVATHANYSQVRGYLQKKEGGPRAPHASASTRQAWWRTWRG